MILSKKLITLLAVGMLALAGCGNSEAAPQVTVTETVDSWSDTDTGTNSGGELSSEDAFLFELSLSGNYLIESMSDYDLLDLGWSTCETLDSGVSLLELVDAFVMSGNFVTDAETEYVGLVIGASIRNLCPQHEWQIASLG